MYIFIDTETTGVNQARDHIVQLAWIIADENGQVLLEKEYIVQPDDFFIPASAVAIHGITNAQAKREGEPIEDVLSELIDDAEDVEYVVAHNASFDLAFLRREYLDTGLDNPFDRMKPYCTMRSSVAFCRFPKLNGGTGYKWPKLDELHFHLFGKYFDGAHDAMADTKACMRCFFELIEQGVIKAPSKNKSIARNRLYLKRINEIPQLYRDSHPVQKHSVTDEFVAMGGNALKPDTKGHPSNDAKLVATGQDFTDHPKVIELVRRYKDSGIVAFQEQITGAHDPFSCHIDEIITDADREAYGDDLVESTIIICNDEYSKFRGKNIPQGVNVFAINEIAEAYGDDIVDLVRRMVWSVLAQKDYLFADQDDIDRFGEDLVNLFFRVALFCVESTGEKVVANRKFKLSNQKLFSEAFNSQQIETLQSLLKTTAKVPPQHRLEALEMGLVTHLKLYQQEGSEAGMAIYRPLVELVRKAKTLQEVEEAAGLKLCSTSVSKSLTTDKFKVLLTEGQVRQGLDIALKSFAHIAFVFDEGGSGNYRCKVFPIGQVVIELIVSDPLALRYLGVYDTLAAFTAYGDKLLNELPIHGVSPSSEATGTSREEVVTAAVLSAKLDPRKILVVNPESRYGSDKCSQSTDSDV